MPCYSGFGNLADGDHPVWRGNFDGVGPDELLFYSRGDSNWWLGSFDAAGALHWRLVSNTAGFGDVGDGRPIWAADFAGTGRTDILFYYPGDRNWWLGQFDSGGMLTWSLAGNTAGFGQVWDGRPFWTGDFTGDGKSDILFYYPGDRNWWLGRFNGTQLGWNLAGNTAGFGQVADGRPFWAADFAGTGRTDILFYYPGDRNWWLGQFDANGALGWSLAGNTAGFGQVWDGRPFWTGDFTGDGKSDILFYYPGDRNWWLGRFNGTQLGWNLAGNTASFGQVANGRPFWAADFAGTGRTDILFYYPGDRNWWLGQFDANGALGWSLAGNTAGFGQVWDGRPFWTGDFTGDGKRDLLFYYPGDGNWWLGRLSGGQLGWNLAGNTGRPYAFRIRLLLKILSTPNVAIDTMLRNMQQVYDDANILVGEGPRENLTVVPAPGAAPQLIFNVGPCNLGQAPTADQTLLFGNRNNAGATDIVVYFVQATNPPLNGCAAFPPGQPGVVVSQGASPWTLAHEVGHVLGLTHLATENTGCPAANPTCCSTPDFTRLMTGCGTGNITATPAVVSAEITTMTGSGFTRRC